MDGGHWLPAFVMGRAITVLARGVLVYTYTGKEDEAGFYPLYQEVICRQHFPLNCSLDWKKK